MTEYSRSYSRDKTTELDYNHKGSKLGSDDKMNLSVLGEKTTKSKFVLLLCSVSFRRQN